MTLSKNMNVPKGTLTKPTHVVSKINIRLIMLISMMWPAVILANRRKANEMGLVNNPMSSTGIMMGASHLGTPGVLKICCQ